MDDLATVVDPDAYLQGYPHALWARMRREPPVWVDYDRPGATPFWAVTRWHDVVHVSRQPEHFSNRPRFVVNPENPAVELGMGGPLLVSSDPPEHRIYRRILSGTFTPRALRSWEPRIDGIVSECVAGLGLGERRQGDFVREVALPIPLAVIGEMLGVPRDDWPLMTGWVNQIVGASDPEYRGARDPAETAAQGRRELFAYFTDLAERRRRRPADDLVSRIVQARPEGREMPMQDVLAYCFLLVNAGNETTRNALTGGVLALIEHRGELARLRAEPGLLERAVEEILRWTSPVVQFRRNAVRDSVVGGRSVRAGESLVLFYPSANRDEDLFESPEAFRIDRQRNPHLAFGIGEHVCLGAHLARMELRSALRHLLPNLGAVELVEPVVRLRSCIVGGIKRMVVRYGAA